MADDTSKTPMFQIQRMYLKDLSLEQPNSPQILLEQGQPAVEINLTLGAEPIGDGMYEVTVMATVKDDRNLSASANTVVAVQAPASPPTASHTWCWNMLKDSTSTATAISTSCQWPRASGSFLTCWRP